MKLPIYNESSAFYLDLDFKDTDGSAYVPSSLVYKVNAPGGTVMQAQTSVTPDSSVTILINASANIILNNNNSTEERTVTITANDGLTSEFNDVYKYQVRNFNFV